MESGTLPLGSNRAPRPCHILNSSGSILPSGFTLFLSRRTTCARGEPVVPACEQLWWAQREIPFGSLKTRFLQPLPSPTPSWPLPSAPARVLAAIRRVTSIKPKQNRDPAGRRNRPTSVRQHVADGVPATDRKLVRKQNPNNTWWVKTDFHPIKCFHFKHPLSEFS